MIRTLSTVDNWRSRRSLGNFAKVSRVAGLHFLELQSGAHMETPFDANGVKRCRDGFFSTEVCRVSCELQLHEKLLWNWNFRSFSSNYCFGW